MKAIEDFFPCLLGGGAIKQMRLLAKPGNGQEVIMATYPGVNLGTTQAVSLHGAKTYTHHL